MPPALIGSTSFSDERIAVELLDPDGNERWRGEPASRASRSNPDAVVEIADDGSALVRDVARFRRLLEDLAEARLLTLAGFQNSAAQRIATWPGGVRGNVEGERADEYRDQQFGIFDGARMRLPLGGGEYVEAFMGVERDIVAAVQADDDEARQRADEDWHTRVEGSLDGQDGALVLGDEGEQRVTVVLRDGILVSLRSFEQ